MNKRLAISFAFFIIIIPPSFAQLADFTSVHSHNDYKQERPFWEAYEARCGSIEVDVFLLNDTLFVAHEVETIDRSKTLNSLYLKPITEVLTDSQSTPFQLLIDVKTEANSTLNSLVSELQKYPELLTQNKVHFVISGNRPVPQDYKNYPSYIFFDHQSIEDLESIDLSKIALVSLPFYRTFLWNGRRELPAEIKQKVTEIVKLVHSKKLSFRFWGTPDTELSWETMHELDLDFINTDKPKKCHAFLTDK